MSMAEESKKLNIDEMVEELRQLNPGAFIREVPVLFGSEKYIKGNVPIEQLKLPKGVHYNSDRIMQEADVSLIDGFFYTNN